MFRLKSLIQILLLFLLVSHINSQSVIDASKCTEPNQYFNYIYFRCDTCQFNQVRSSPTFCNCTNGYYKNKEVVGFQSPSSCLSFTQQSSTYVYLLNNRDGSQANTPLNCSNNSYPNSQRTKCIPCPRNMQYNTTSKSCFCTDNNYQNINGKCIPRNSSTNPQLATFGCVEQSTFHPQYCQMLLNLCSRDGFNPSTTYCSIINQYNLSNRASGGTFPKYTLDQSELYLNELGISVSTSEFTNTTLLKNKLEFYVAEYNGEGAFIDFRPLRGELFSCELSEGDTIKLQSFGTGYTRECTLQVPSVNMYYDLYIKGSNGQFAAVPIEFVNTNRTYVRRFTQSTQSIKLNLTSLPPLLTPIVTLTMLQNTATSLTIQNQSVTSNNYVLLPPFIIVMAIVLGYYIYAMFLHVKYNPENLGENTYCFRMMWGALWLALRCWTVGLFVWLAGVSMFCFCFYKFQTALYMILPDPNDEASKLAYYTPFKTVFFIMAGMGILSLFETVWRIASAEYFLLDWEKPKENPGKFSTQHNNKEVKPSIWRRLFVVNELYELAMKRLCSVEFTLLFSGLFLQGLKWSNLKYMIPNSDVNSLSSVTNPVLGYFITSFLLITISLAQIVIRKLLKIWWPLPQQQFIDLCCMSNLSIFIFDQGIHGYYIHGMNPLGKSEGSLQYIESIFDKQSESYGRNRGLLEQDEDQIQSYEVIAPRVMRFQFNKLYVQRTQQILANGVMANTFIQKPVPQLRVQHYDNLEKLREQMINNFRLYLQEVKIHKNMQIQERNWFTRMFSCPPNSSLHEKLPVMYKDSDYLFTNVFLSGNQLFLLINQINIFNFWYMIIGNTYHSIILTMVIKIAIGFFIEFKMKRNISLNTFVDDKFFV